jgi:rare lipoprotein A
MWIRKISIFSLGLLFCGGCTSFKSRRYYSTKKAQEFGGFYKIGKPYSIQGKTYYPRENKNYWEEGIASWYGEGFHRKKTANGAVFDINGMTAAHRTLPLPSVVRVTNLNNNKNVLLVINDRGPFVQDRIIDVSKKAAEKLGFLKNGITRVRVEFLEKQTQQFLQKNGIRKRSNIN